MDCSTPGFPVLHHLPELAQTYVYWVGDAIQPSHLLLSPFPPAPNPSQHQGLFQSVKIFLILKMEINDYPTLNTVLRITHNACTILKHKGSFQSMLVIIIIIPLCHRISSSLWNFTLYEKYSYYFRWMDGVSMSFLITWLRFWWPRTVSLQV